MTHHTKKNISKAIGSANLARLDGAKHATVASGSEPPIALRTCTPVSSGTRIRAMRLTSQDFPRTARVISCLPGGPAFDPLLVLRPLKNRVHIEPRRVHVIRIERTEISKLFHFRNHVIGRGCHHRIEIPRRFPVNQIAPAVAFPGLDEGKVSADSALHYAACHQLLEQLVLAHIGRNHLLHLAFFQQHADAESVDAGIVRNNGQVPGALPLYRRNQILRNPAESKPADQNGHSVFQVRNCLVRRSDTFVHKLQIPLSSLYSSLAASKSASRSREARRSRSSSMRRAKSSSEAERISWLVRTMSRQSV